MVAIIGNGHCDPSSNPGQGILQSTNNLVKSMNQIIPPPTK